MQVKEIDITTGKIKGYGICKIKYKISVSVAVNDGYSVLMSLWEQQITSAKYPHTIISHHRVITNKT